MRCLKRHLSNVIYRCLVDDHVRASNDEPSGRGLEQSCDGERGAFAASR